MPSIGDHAKRHAHPPLTLRWLPGRYAICRLAPETEVPEWTMAGDGFVSVTRTDEELSVILDERFVPDDERVAVEPGWVGLRVVGRLDFALVGILAKLTGTLAAAGVPVCAVSTFDTDILLVKQADVDRAAAALATVAELEPMTEAQS